MEEQVIPPVITNTLDTSNVEGLLSKMLDNQDKIINRLDLANGLLIGIIVIILLGWIYKYVSNIIGEF